MKTNRRNLGQPEDYSKKDILEGILYIATELGAFKSRDQVDAEIAKAELAATNKPAPDRTAFKAKILEHIETRDAERNSTGPITEVDFEQPPIAMAARKRKKPSSKRSGLKKPTDDASSGS
jgi:hypothetical protein